MSRCRLFTSTQLSQVLTRDNHTRLVRIVKQYNSQEWPSIISYGDVVNLISLTLFRDNLNGCYVILGAIPEEGGSAM